MIEISQIIEILLFLAVCFLIELAIVAFIITPIVAFAVYGTIFIAEKVAELWRRIKCRSEREEKKDE